MKRIPLLSLAALLLLSACQPNAASPGPPPTETEPSAPIAPPREDLTPPAGDEPALVAPDLPTEAGTASVAFSQSSGSVEESVSWSIQLPQVSTASAAADEAIGAYYEGVSKKLRGLAQGEVYEQSLSEHSVLHLAVESSVERNGGGLLSISRTVAIYDLQDGGSTQVTSCAETFDLSTGGLVTPDDLFDTDEETWTARLLQCAARQIREDPSHETSYDPQWEALLAQRFERDQFYLTDEAYVLFYQIGDLRDGSATFPVPWRQLADILKTEV